MKKFISSSILLSFFSIGFSQENISEEQLSGLPILFRENKGQWDKQVLYSGSAQGANVSFLKNELSFAFIHPVKKKEAEKKENHREETLKEAYEIYERAWHPEKKQEEEILVWNLRFKDANQNSVITSYGKADSKANYFIGNNPKNYCTNVPDYKMLVYKNIYDNVDLKYYGNENRLK